MKDRHFQIQDILNIKHYHTQKFVNTAIVVKLFKVKKEEKNLERNKTKTTYYIRESKNYRING